MEINRPQEPIYFRQRETKMTEQRLTPRQAYKRARVEPEFRPEAERIIEAAGDGCYAYLMVRECGSSTQWAMRIIQDSGDGVTAYLMVKFCGLKREWAERIIEAAGDGESAYCMVRYCGSDQAWAEKVGAGNND